MEPFKAILAESQGEETVAVATAENITFNFSMPDAETAISDGNFTIGGNLKLKLLNGSTTSATMPTISKRLKDLAVVISNMPAGAEKTKAQAEYDNWSNMMTTIRSAIASALKTNYELNNP
ncbi:hypothetical protein [Pedobacter sp.]|uniref:hypothetical protein n=1 Tax=Pedobacter sp. TaxID=1411316 RepID=UPI00396C930A